LKMHCRGLVSDLHFSRRAISRNTGRSLHQASAVFAGGIRGLLGREGMAAECVCRRAISGSAGRLGGERRSARYCIAQRGYAFA
jgi:hypothetical protein